MTTTRLQLLPVCCLIALSALAAPDSSRAQTHPYHYQEFSSAVYRNPAQWTEKSVLNVAGMGRFSSDRTIAEYARDIWGVKPVQVRIPDSGKGS